MKHVVVFVFVPITLNVTDFPERYQKHTHSFMSKHYCEELFKMTHFYIVTTFYPHFQESLCHFSHTTNKGTKTLHGNDK